MTLTINPVQLIILDGRRPPRPMSVDSQTQTDHICEKPVEFSKYRSPCQSPGRSIRVSFLVFLNNIN